MQSTHLKLIAELYDKCQEVCTQVRGGGVLRLPDAAGKVSLLGSSHCQQALAGLPTEFQCAGGCCSFCNTPPSACASNPPCRSTPSSFSMLCPATSTPPCCPAWRQAPSQGQSVAGPVSGARWRCMRCLPVFPGRKPPLQSLLRPSAALPVQELATEYCIDPEIIFSLYRPLIRHIEPPAAPSAPEEEEEGEVADGSSKGAGRNGGAAQPHGSSGAGANGPEPMEEEGEVAVSPRAADKAAVAVHPANGPAAEAPEVQRRRWEELERQVGCVAASRGRRCCSYALALSTSTSSALSALLAFGTLPLQVHGMHGGSGGVPPWRGMSPALYTTFWVLQLYDLEVPVAR